MYNQQNKGNNTILITELLPQYRHLNTVYLEVIKGSNLDYKNQYFITDFYQKYRDARAFDQMLINLILSTDKEKQLLLIQSLNAEINKNIDFYNKNTDFLINIDTLEICSQEPKEFDGGIKLYQEIVGKLWHKLVVIRGNLESASWHGNQKETERLFVEEECINKSYKKEKQELDLLYNQQYDCQIKTIQYNENVFREIFELSKSFLSILESYTLNDDDTNKSQAEQIPSHSNQYFDMNIVSMIHKECNSIQFENITELDLYLNLNNRPSEGRLIIKNGEKTRVCYLIYKLYEHLQCGDKIYWKNNILNRLDISESYYASKYKEPVSEIPSQKSEKFVKVINEFFKS